jgi:hypothetical protein
MKPDIPPPRTRDLVFDGKASLGLRRNVRESEIKNTPKISLRVVCDRSPTKVAPIKLRVKLGNPNTSKTLLSRPCLKKVILLIFPNRWNMATRTNAVLKSTKYDASGKKIVDEPNPAIVPMISDMKPTTKKMMSINSMFVTCYFL